MKSLMFIPILLLSACATGNHPKPYASAGGGEGYKLSCSEFNTSLDQCKAQASKMCLTGAIVDEYLTYRETFPDAGDGFYMPAKNHVVVACKESDSKS